jgi:hypothetical protein
VFARVEGLANTPTDSLSYVEIGLQLPSDLANGQTFDCKPAAMAREVFEVDVNGDTLSKLTQGEYVAYGFAYPRTGWIAANAQPTAKTTIKRVSKTRMDIHLRFTTQFAPDVGIVNIDQTFTFDREPRNAK